MPPSKDTVRPSEGRLTVPVTHPPFALLRMAPSSIRSPGVRAKARLMDYPRTHTIRRWAGSRNDEPSLIVTSPSTHLFSLGACSPAVLNTISLA